METGFSVNSIEHYKMIFDNNHFVMLLIDPQTGEIKDVNNAALCYYGYSYAELCDKNIADINILPVDEVKRQMSRAKNKVQSRFFFQHRLADGSVRDVEVFSGPVNNGSIALIYSIVHDITRRREIETALAHSEVKFRKYIEFAPHGVFVTDRNCRCLEANPAAERITGTSIEELRNKDLFQLVPSHSRELARSKFLQVIKDGFVTCVMPFTRKDGSEGYISIDAVELSKERFLGNVTDITRQMVYEKALKENERLLRESQSAGNIGSYSVDLITRRWIASEEVYRIFGIPLEHPNTLQVWVDAVHPQFRENLLEELFSNTTDRKTFEHEYKIIRASDGMERWVNGNGKFEFENQKKIRLIGTIQDVTNRKHAEEELKSLNEQLKQLNGELEERVRERTRKVAFAEEKYRTIADYNYHWETWMDTEGDFIYVSPSCRRISGYSAEEFKANPNLFFEIAHPVDRLMVKGYFEKAQKRLISDVSFDFRILTKNNEERWLSHYCNPVYDKNGKWLGLRGSSSDITIRKQVEENMIESQNKLRVLTRYINDVAEKERITIAREIHDELGHMLTALKYEMYNMQEEKKLSVKQVKSGVSVMIGMVDSLIESVRKIATELRPGILDHLGLFPAIEWQVNQFRLRKKINCNFRSSSPDLTFTKEETSNIFRILQEILTNVARHSKAKNINVSIGEEKNNFLMTVSDDGIGFDTSDRIITSSPGLTGMHERALTIGGRIQINSAPGKGTTVIFLLQKQ